MNEFLEYIKTYLQSKFTEDTEITKTITIENAYKQGNEITTTNVPQIQIQIMDNSEVERYSTFEGENVSSIPLQITSYTGQMKIAQITKSAQEASIIFGQKIKKYLNMLRESNINANILRCRISSMSPAMPLLEGSKVYATAIRCDFWIANPYVSLTQTQN